MNYKKKRHIAAVSACAIVSLAAMHFSFADELAETSAFSSSDLEPSINIEQHENRTIEEYSVNDNVYMIKVTPKYGAPYTLVDPDGTGEMEWRRDTLGMEVNPPRWTLFSW